jgi:DNA-binding NarL/FixJ family response regulator
MPGSVETAIKPVNIIIADDHSIFREGLKKVLKKIPFVGKITEAVNGKEALAFAEKGHYHVVLMDIEMPEMNGVEATRFIHDKFPHVKIIALTMYANQKYITELYDAGVSGYILKNTTMEELSKAIKLVSDNEQYYCKEVSDVLYKALLKRDKLTKESVELEKVSSREADILKLLCEQYTEDEIAEKLFISIKTVKVHKRNLFEKTHSKNLAGLVVYAIRQDIYRI